MSVLEKRIFEKNGLFKKYCRFADDVENAAINLSTNPLTIAIDAPWGEGKTTFLKYWKEKLEEKYTVIYFNSWEHDFINDPLIAIYLTLVTNFLEKHKSIDEGSVLQVLTSYFKITLSKQFHKAGIASLEEITKDTQSYYRTIKNIFMEESKLSQEFKKTLAEIVKKEKNPVFFIIDELDRCKPLFSIKILESIKHFMGVENIVFVLGVHKVELANAVNAVYGNKFDSIAYLERFIDYDFHLPVPTGMELASELFYRSGISINETIKNNNKQALTKLEKELIVFIGSFFVLYNVPFRKAEKIMKKIKLTYIYLYNLPDNTIKTNDHVCLIALFILFRMVDSENYLCLLNKQHNENESFKKKIELLEKIITDGASEETKDYFNNLLFLTYDYAVIKAKIKEHISKGVNFYDKEHQKYEIIQKHFGEIKHYNKPNGELKVSFPPYIDIVKKILNTINLLNDFD